MKFYLHLLGLNEVNGIKILINGEENKSFADGVINFEKEFYVIENNN